MVALTGTVVRVCVYTLVCAPRFLLPLLEHFLGQRCLFQVQQRSSPQEGAEPGQLHFNSETLVKPGSRHKVGLCLISFKKIEQRTWSCFCFKFKTRQNNKTKTKPNSQQYIFFRDPCPPLLPSFLVLCFIKTLALLSFFSDISDPCRYITFNK